MQKENPWRQGPGLLVVYGVSERLHHLEQAGCAHAAADTHRDDNVPGAATPTLDQGVADQTRARHPVRVADRDRPAVDIEDLIGDAELVTAVESLHGKRLVEFPKIDIVHFEVMFLQQLRHRIDGSDAHFIRRAAGGDHAAIDSERVQTTSLGFLCLHDHRSRGAIGKLRGIAGSNVLAFLDDHSRP